MFDFFFSDCFSRQDKKMSNHVMIHCIKYLKTCRTLKIDEQINLKKMIFFLKNYKMIETEFTFSVSASSETEKT